jgi:hypothetical protein
MTPEVDGDVVRKFIEIISKHAGEVINGADRRGVLQLCRIHPLHENVVPRRFCIDDVEAMVKAAVDDATCEHNVYIEGRTVREDLHGNKRGSVEDTAWVFALVVDCDADKGKGGNVTARPSLAIETSPGNYHLWYLLARAITATQARLIGDVIRANSGADQDTGVITQCYRVAGTPNFPSKAKRARGRMAIEPTQIFEHTGLLWDPDELLAAFSTAPASPNQQQSTATPDNGDESTLPDDLLKIIREGVATNSSTRSGGDKTRSALFHRVIAQLKKRRWSLEAIIALLEKYPNGIAKKFISSRPADKWHKEVKRSYDKVSGVVAIKAPAGASAATGGMGAAAAGPAPQPRVIPTIRLVDGQLPRVVEEAERALAAADLPVFSRAGTLVEPVSETMTTASGRKTVIARLRSFCVDSLLEPVAESALFQRFSSRRNLWVDIDPPLQLVRMILSRERRWTIPRVSGVITTPTIRADGSLLTTPGYDPRSGLYLLPGLPLPLIPEHPSKEAAQAALESLKDLFCEFSFAQPLDRAVAISGLLTALVRGALSTAPLYLVRAHTPGTGKSYLVDVIAMISSGRLCPVITASTNKEETEKRIGSILLSGASIVSLDNCIHDLGGELLCQLTERPVVKIRILGRSEMPECECRTAVFATGNNIAFLGDMVRRGLVCNLEALDERPELRTFQRDTLDHATVNRDSYLVAGLTIIRAYLTAGAPNCKALGSYPAWSTMVRSSLVWLGEPDPITSMDLAREEDQELIDIREFFDLWRAYLNLDEDYTTSQIIDVACATPAPNNFNPPVFKEFLLRVAAEDKGVVSAQRLGKWLRKIGGRVLAGHRLIISRNRNVAAFQLKKV